MSATILGPAGTPFVELGGERAWRQRVIGDIVVSYQWLDLRALGDAAAEPEPEPCLCLFPAFRRLETGAYTIPQRNAYAYVDNRGNPTPQLLMSAMRAADTLGFDPNDRAAVKRMIDVIVEGIPDLIDMPSEQPGALGIKRAVRGVEVEVKAGGRAMHSEVV